MKVYGVEIPQVAINAAVSRMDKQPFTAVEIKEVLEKNGVQAGSVYASVSYRAADRIIQQQRKAGNIVYSSGQWKWRENG